MWTGSSHLRGWWECSPCLCSAGTQAQCCCAAGVNLMNTFPTYLFSWALSSYCVSLSPTARSLVFKFPGAGRFTFLKLVTERTVACPEFLHGTICQMPCRVLSVWQEWSRIWEAPLDIANLVNFCILPFLDYKYVRVSSWALCLLGQLCTPELCLQHRIVLIVSPVLGYLHLWSLRRSVQSNLLSEFCSVEALTLRYWHIFNVTFNTQGNTSCTFNFEIHWFFSKWLSFCLSHMLSSVVLIFLVKVILSEYFQVLKISQLKEDPHWSLSFYCIKRIFRRIFD